MEILSRRTGTPTIAAPEQKPGSPLYLQVARTLKEEILNGAFPVGSQLPTEHALRQRFAVSRFTVREALRQLREDGLVISRQGAGTVVVPSSPSNFHVLNSMSINDLLNLTGSTHLEIEVMRMLTVAGGLAARIGVPEGDEWLAVHGFRHEDGADSPVCWTEYYINREFAAVGRLLPRHHGPIFPLIEDLFAVSIAEVSQEIASVLISREQAVRHLVPEGSAALQARRVYKTADGKIVQVTINIYPASRFKLSMTMRRIRP
jgi:DNA-binding GntR family transcriptional regulator